MLENWQKCQFAALSDGEVVDTISHFQKLNISKCRNHVGFQKWLFQSANIQIHEPENVVRTTVSRRRISRYARSAAHDCRLTCCARPADFTWVASSTTRTTKLQRRSSHTEQSASRISEGHPVTRFFRRTGLIGTELDQDRQKWVESHFDETLFGRSS